ncbi:nascent polypeptide-associated complex protein [Candidatus Pacearchaeota archaeon ex4484_71]|nr:MAG: nascent polypeptide-associated complex protein [Candidatus Pacearchaeota archaeon ex4484_71]
MFGGINPKKMQAMMKQMGMSQEEIDSSKVIIEKSDGSKINFQGQETWQISGDSIEESAETKISEEDIKTVMEKSNCDKETALKALEETDGDLAEAILKLSE